MRHAVFIPPFGPFAEPAAMVELAEVAEDAGWDGLFLWDHMWTHGRRPPEVGDPWILMAAIACRTRRLRLGPMVTPLARRRPQKVARETVTLDRLSGGRLTLGVGLGVDTGGELRRFGEETDDRRRADVLDEALEVLLGLWSGEVVDHHGPAFTAEEVRFLPPPAQQPRIPIWVAARGGTSARPLRRAAGADGLFPVDTTTDQLASMLEVIARRRGTLDGYDVAFEVDDPASLGPLEALGVTWAVYSVGAVPRRDEVFARVGAGPPS